MVSDEQRWITVYAGPTWKTLAIRSMLDEAGFLTQVPDAYSNMGGSLGPMQSVLVPESESAAARSAIETSEMQAEPRSP